MEIQNIPVTHYGTQIGIAQIRDDGDISIQFDEDEAHELGIELMKAIKKGVVTGLSLSPVMPPAQPAVTIHMNNGPITPGGRVWPTPSNSGIQIGNGNTQANHY